MATTSPTLQLLCHERKCLPFPPLIFFFSQETYIRLTGRDGMFVSHVVCASVSQKELFERKQKLFATSFNLRIAVLFSR